MNEKKYRLIILINFLLILLVFLTGCQKTVKLPYWNAPDYQLSGDDRLVGKNHLVSDIPTVNQDSTVNVVVEIPAGTREKWEVEKETGQLVWEMKNGSHRVVRYLGYPGNYGMVPRTLLSETEGGDGDPLDVIVLGSSVPRGSILAVRIIGCLKLLDGGETDDKLVAVMPGDVLDVGTSLPEFEEAFPGVLSIVETWFVHYKGKGQMESGGFEDRDYAWHQIDYATDAYLTNLHPE